MIDMLPRVNRYWLWMRSSIAFVPFLWVVGFVVLALLMRYLESIGVSGWLEELTGLKFIASEDTARSILTAIIGGVISLTVFSFSMVMIVLSQATSTLSPRLLPQLIRDRSHQTTLGLYLGVIVFCFLTLLAIDPGENWQMNAFSILLSVALAIVSLFFFVYFIASISRRIQIGEVIKDVHRRAVEEMKSRQAGNEEWSLRGVPEGHEHWYSVKALESGYIDLTVYYELSALAGNFGTRFFLQGPRGQFVNTGAVLFTSERPLTNEELQQAAEALRLTENRETEFWYFPAIRHITEVAVKAMSPGINDPGTAVEAVNLLSDLLIRLLRMPITNHFRASSEDGEVYFATRPFAYVIQTVTEEIRVYAKADPLVMRSLYRLLHTIRLNSKDVGILATASRELEALREDGIVGLTNSLDRENFLKLFD